MHLRFWLSHFRLGFLFGCTYALSEQAIVRVMSELAQDWAQAYISQYADRVGETEKQKAIDSTVPVCTGDEVNDVYKYIYLPFMLLLPSDNPIDERHYLAYWSLYLIQYLCRRCLTSDR
jgi:hypothetical protein